MRFGWLLGKLLRKQDCGKTSSLISCLVGGSLKSLYRNGDVLFVSFERPVELDEDAPMATSAPIGQQVKPWQVKQHPIDDLLESQDGSIKRSRSTLYVSSTIRGPVAKLTDDVAVLTPRLACVNIAFRSRHTLRSTWRRTRLSI